MLGAISARHTKLPPRDSSSSSSSSSYKQQRPRLLVPSMAAAFACAPQAGALDQQPWPPAMTAAYLTWARDWQAVEAFYADLVAGRACLSQLGLAPAGAAALTQEQRQGDEQQQQQQQQQQQDDEQQQQQQEDKDKEPQQQDDEEPQQRQLFDRTTYKVCVSYFGPGFSGWVRQPGKRSVEGSLAAAIAAAGLTAEPLRFVNKAKRAAAKQARRAAAKQARLAAADPTGQQQQEQHQGPPACGGGPGDGGPGEIYLPSKLPQLACGGRTDAGVSAAAQVVSFYSWHPALDPDGIVAAINRQVPGVLSAPDDAAAAAAAAAAVAQARARGVDGVIAAPHPEAPAADCHLRVVSVQQVQQSFHAAFSAVWRRYVYLLPLRAGALLQQPIQQPGRQHEALSPQEAAAVQAAADVDAAAVHGLLQQLQGRLLNYNAFARDTPPGKECECVLHTARACLVALPPAAGNQPQQCLCMELVGNRFLRRMVRVLVATAVREALAGGGDEQRLVQLMGSGADRRSTAPPAPAAGLCFAAVGYSLDE